MAWSSSGNRTGSIGNPRTAAGGTSGNRAGILASGHKLTSKGHHFVESILYVLYILYPNIFTVDTSTLRTIGL